MTTCELGELVGVLDWHWDRRCEAEVDPAARVAVMHYDGVHVAWPGDHRAATDRARNHIMMWLSDARTYRWSVLRGDEAQSEWKAGRMAAIALVKNSGALDRDGWLYWGTFRAAHEIISGADESYLRDDDDLVLWPDGLP